jgi:hypothetical protein
VGIHGGLPGREFGRTLGLLADRGSI